MLLASKYDQVSMFINDQSNSWLVQITFCLVINAFVWNTHSIIVLPPRTHKQYRTHKLAYPGDDIRGCALTLWFWLLILANSNLWKGDIQKVPGETTYALIVVVVVCCPCWVAASTIPKQQHASFSAFFSYLNLSHNGSCLTIFYIKKKWRGTRVWQGAVVSLYLVTRAHCRVYAYNFNGLRRRGRRDESKDLQYHVLFRPIEATNYTGHSRVWPDWSITLTRR